MNPPYQLLLDIWEGNPDLDVAALKAAGVVGLIVRLNSMNGGHHMDERFTQNWELAKQFAVQSIYFVYNPWKNGRDNYDWLMAHLPADYGRRRLFPDIEVRYSGYAPATYAAETKKFMALTRANFPATRYSGGGFLDILTPWPTDEDYWWAAYSTSLTECRNWNAYQNILAVLDYDRFTQLCPGKARMWQASANGSILPGFGNHAVDTNIFPGTLADLHAWFNLDNGSEETMTWTNNAIGLYTKTAGWTNPDFNFIVGYAGGDWSKQGDALVLEPNPNLKPIEEQAHAEGKPCLMLWDFDVDYYRRQQYDAKDSTWPGEALDYPFQRLKAALANRNPDGLIVRVLNRKNVDGGDEDMFYVAFAAGKFVDRANKWLYQNKGLDKWTFVLTNDDFIHTDGKQENFNTWLKNWWLGIEQPAVRPLASGAWPQAADKIKAIPPSLGWKFWDHYQGTPHMMLYNGTDADCRAFLGYGVEPPVEPPAEPPTQPVDLTPVLDQLTEIRADIAALTQRINAIYK